MFDIITPDVVPLDTYKGLSLPKTPLVDPTQDDSNSSVIHTDGLFWICAEILEIFRSPEKNLLAPPLSTCTST